jgi:hypothetical protein
LVTDFVFLNLLLETLLQAGRGCLRRIGRCQQDSHHDEDRRCAPREHSAIPFRRRERYMIGELEEAFVRACPSFASLLKQLREDHKLFGADLQTELTEVLDKLGFHLGSTAREIPTVSMIHVLKVVERVLVDGSEQQKWAVTHFLMPSLQTSIRETGQRTDALLPHLGPATQAWWHDLTKNPCAAHEW